MVEGRGAPERPRAWASSEEGLSREEEHSLLRETTKKSNADGSFDPALLCRWLSGSFPKVNTHLQLRCQKSANISTFLFLVGGGGKQGKIQVFDRESCNSFL